MRMEAGLTDAGVGAGALDETPLGVDDATAAADEVREGVAERALTGLEDDPGLQAEMARVAAHRITDTDRGQPAVRNDDRKP